MNKRVVFLLAVMAAGLLLAWIYLPVLSQYRDLKSQEQEMDRDIEKLDQQIQKLFEEKKLLLEDRDYLEKVVRDELGLVKPGEVIYKFISEEPKGLETEVIHLDTQKVSAAQAAN